jgi:hypothetical protein
MCSFEVKTVLSVLSPFEQHRAKKPPQPPPLHHESKGQRKGTGGGCAPNYVFRDGQSITSGRKDRIHFFPDAFFSHIAHFEE